MKLYERASEHVLFAGNTANNKESVLAHLKIAHSALFSIQEENLAKDISELCSKIRHEPKFDYSPEFHIINLKILEKTKKKSPVKKTKHRDSPRFSDPVENTSDDTVQSPTMEILHLGRKLNEMTRGKVTIMYPK
ncbi:MAG: hypothetical protein KBC17_01365 [Candidatus Pacebacteria bacterium]|nr:hypothetical protein [Candidatus Paceibacterota bacterium]